ncbi:hypothetical protein ASD65_09955 [Microbacterium sp. Root61]|uniref:MaoC/PaaZ C-terminal domain-containing protein n=1 Tax=Microbacterium sp. Root61 TaxID=1736570 RepID=UPI0006FF7098|nr:MaoC/PaaZ C-terminal domain-containing protein [Microbacterium sp. Root61]KRA24704.1 hypothetical protein ASD65_09955 [Microbacterium sp. Root61]
MTKDDVLFSQTFGPLTRTDLVRYAGAGGDFNPIHHDEIFARSAGYPSVIAHGLLTAGIAGGALAEAVGPLRLRRFAVRYSGQVFPGDTLTVTATESGAHDARVHYSIEVLASGEAGSDRKVLSAEAEVDA